MFHTRRQATTQTQSARPASASRTGSIHLTLALLAALLGSLVGLAPAVAQGAASLELTPSRGRVGVNQLIRYFAHAVDGNGSPLDVNNATRLEFDPDGDRCTQDATRAGIEVRCQETGTYTVVGVLRDPEVRSPPVQLEVVAEPVLPRITSVAPRVSPPNSEVVVKGTTGPCNQAGTLTVEGIAVAPQPVTGSFTARFTVPSGTFPGKHLVELSVKCDRQVQLDRKPFRVRNLPPTAADDDRIITGPELSIDVTTNDTDPDGNDGYQVVVDADPPMHGTAEVVGEDVVYRPGTGFIDRDRFIYRHCDVVDAAGTTACGTGTVTVTRPDPRPVDDRDVTTKQETQVPILVTENDSNPIPARLRVRTDPKDGKAVVQDRPLARDGHILYTPRKDFTGTDSFEYDYCEGVDVGPNVAAPGTCPHATVSVTVAPPDPVAVDDPDETTDQDHHVDIDVMENDKHPVASDLRVRPDPAPEGTAEVQSNGTVRYTPDAEFSGKDSFQYDYCKPVIGVTARAACDPATVTVDVTPRVLPAIKTVNPTPPNKDVKVTGTTGSCNQVGTLLLDLPEGDDVSVPVTGDQDGNFEVALPIPGGTFVGSYPLELHVDCHGKDQVAREKLAVENKAPDAADDDATTSAGVEVLIPVTGNDTDPDGDDGYKTALEVDQPAHGKTVPQPDDQVLYIPENGFSDVDQFTYRLCDIVNAQGARDCGSATVTVIVKPPNPKAVDDPNETTLQEQQVAILVIENDINPAPPRLQVSTKPKDGTAVVQETPRDGHILYTPRKGFTGKDSFQYDYCRPVPNLTALAACEPATVTVDVRSPPTQPVIETVAPSPTPPNQEVTVTGSTGSCNQAGTLVLHLAPPGADVPVPVTGAFAAKVKVPGGTFVGIHRLELEVDCRGRAQTAEKTLEVANKAPDAVDDAASTPADTPVTIPVTDNDTDPDGEDGYGTSFDVGQPADGRTEAQPGDQVRYTPDDGFSGEDRFTYTICDIVDANGATDCDTATVTVTVGRRKPVPVDDPDVTTLRDQPVVVAVMENDRDPDAARLQVKRPGRPGAEAERQSDGTVRYTPEPGFIGVDTFQYDYCGGSVDVTATGTACPSATVTVDVTDTPVISSVRPGATPPGRAVEVTGNTGSCNRAGTLALQGTGATATVTGQQDGGFTSRLTIPAGTFPGPHRLELRVDCKGQLQRAEAELTVTNKAPVAVDDAASTTRDQAARIPVTDNDRDPDDPDGHRARVLVADQPDHGTAQEQPDLSIVYTPERGFIGTDRFRYSLCDDVLNAAEQADCGSATVTVTVTDVPVISSVEPRATSPGRPVEVAGNTGSCNRAGTLTLSGAVDLRVGVTGDQTGGFTTTLAVPDGTFPGVYKLELAVDCDGRVQRAEAELTVVNQAPVAADDEVSTTADTATAIEVTGNDRDPDDPDTYPTRVMVADGPERGTAEARPDLSIVYTPERGFVGTDRFRYSLCDDVLNAARHADCGTATVTVEVSPVDCAPSAGGDPRLSADPNRGRGGTKLRITATVDPRLASCQFRLLLGGTPLGPDVTAGDDGSISAERGVPGDVRPGSSPIRLATMAAETLDEIPFEVVDDSPSWLAWLGRLALGAGALLAGFLARAGLRRWRKPDDRQPDRRTVESVDDIRAEPHTRPVEPTVEPVNDTTRSMAVRLEPHPDSGTQTLEEVTR